MGQQQAAWAKSLANKPPPSASDDVCTFVCEDSGQLMFLQIRTEIEESAWVGWREMLKQRRVAPVSFPLQT